MAERSNARLRSPCFCPARRGAEPDIVRAYGRRLPTASETAFRSRKLAKRVDVFVHRRHTIEMNSAHYRSPLRLVPVVGFWFGSLLAACESDDPTAQPRRLFRSPGTRRRPSPRRRREQTPTSRSRSPRRRRDRPSGRFDRRAWMVPPGHGRGAAHRRSIPAGRPRRHDQSGNGVGVRGDGARRPRSVRAHLSAPGRSPPPSSLLRCRPEPNAVHPPRTFHRRGRSRDRAHAGAWVSRGTPQGDGCATPISRGPMTSCGETW